MCVTPAYDSGNVDTDIIVRDYLDSPYFIGMRENGQPRPAGGVALAHADSVIL